MSITNSINTLDPFRLEELRHELAAQKNYYGLLKTYKNHLPSITKINTSKEWDKLNFDANKKSEQYFEESMGTDRIKRIKKILQACSGYVLNIGFGSAELEKQFHKQFIKENWHGIDISKKSVANARSTFNSHNFRLGSATKLPFTSNKFDVVVASEVLEHIPPSHIFKVLSEIRRVIKDDGTLIVSIPINEGLKEMVENGINPNHHARTYSLELITAELAISGFKIADVQKLYAFKDWYHIKTIIANLLRLIGIEKWRHNNLIIACKKQ